MNLENIIYLTIYLALAIFFYYLSRLVKKDLQKYLNNKFKGNAWYFRIWSLITAIFVPYTYLESTRNFKRAYFLLLFYISCDIIMG